MAALASAVTRYAHQFAPLRAPFLQRRRKMSCVRGSQLIEPSLVARSVLVTALSRGSAPAPAADLASVAPPATPAAPAAHPDRLLDGHFRNRWMAFAHRKRRGLGRNRNQGPTGSGNGGTARQDPQHLSAIYGCHRRLSPKDSFVTRQSRVLIVSSTFKKSSVPWHKLVKSHECFAAASAQDWPHSSGTRGFPERNSCFPNVREEMREHFSSDTANELIGVPS
jgi:hypothetical protein